ncbi:hypothetical protein AB0B31_41505 [Catellatospora citrea]|uniref:hypothetical protein n=1 Tax=Catellatospora citrea TaxID=53366 RepID=UPI0033DA4027
MTAATAVVATVAALAAGTVLRVGWPGTAPREVAASPSPLPSPLPRVLEPEVVDGEVRFNGLIIPLAKGWKYREVETAVDYCAIEPKTVVLAMNGLSPGGDCTAHAQIQLSDGWLPYYNAHPALLARKFSLGFNEIVLPGGQPLWLDDNEVHNIVRGMQSSFTAGGLAAPWAAARLSYEMTPAEAATVLQSIRGLPAPVTRLVVPDGVTDVYLNLHGETVHSTDPAVVKQVIEQLRGLERMVQPSELPCAGAKVISPRLPGWSLAAKDMAQLDLVTVNPSASPANARTSVLNRVTVGIGTSTECSYATSSDGGRVWLPAGFAAELHQLIGGKP